MNVQLRKLDSGHSEPDSHESLRIEMTDKSLLRETFGKLWTKMSTRCTIETSILKTLLEYLVPFSYGHTRSQMGDSRLSRVGLLLCRLSSVRYESALLQIAKSLKSYKFK